MIITTHQDRGIDFHLKAVGFSDRENLKIVSHDDRTYHFGRIFAKPDWAVFDSAIDTLYVLDYKTRQPNPKQISLYEATQIAIFGYVAANEFCRVLDRSFNYIMGALYANDERIQVSIDQGDIDRFTAAVGPAIEAYRSRGVDMPRGGSLGASRLARYIADPSLSKPVHKEAARRGDEAHRSLRRYAPPTSIFEHTFAR